MDQAWAEFANRTVQNLRYSFDIRGQADVPVSDRSTDMVRPRRLHLRISHTPGYAVPRSIEAVVEGPYVIDGQESKLGHRVDVWDRPEHPTPRWVRMIVESHLPEGWHQ